MSFDKKGFLGEQIKEFSKQVISENSEIFDLFSDFNKFAHKTKYQFQAHSENGRAIIALCLFIRILNGVQAVVILAKRGLPIESNMILRNLFETLCLLKRVVEDEEFHRKYVSMDLLEKRKLFKVIVEDLDPVFDEWRDDAQNRIKKLSDEIEDLEAEKYSVEKLAGLTGWTSFYNTFYRLLSGDTHTSPRSLEEYIVVDEEDNISSINWGPSDNKISQTLFSSMDFLRMALDLAINFFKADGSKELQSLYVRQQELHERLKQC